MADKTVKTRIQIKRETESSWNTASTSATPFKPLDGELIYYKDKKLLKIGNGTNTPKDLPVLADGCTKDYVSTELGKLKFAGASTQGGAATSAAKLTNTSRIGGPTNPVYFSASGVPVACDSLPYATGSDGIADAARMLVDDNDAALNEGYDDAATNPKHQPVYFKDGIPVAFDPGHAAAADTAGDRPAKGAYRILKSNAIINDNHGVGTENQPIYIDSAGLPQKCTGITIPVDTPVNIAKQLQTGTKFTFNNGAISAPDFVFNGSANADGTQKTINIAATSVDESYLAWGSKNLAHKVSPLDASISDMHRANRFAFMKPEMINISYARGTDTTFTNYSTNAENKVKLVSGIHSDSIYSGKRTTGSVVGDRVRVELSSKYIYDQTNNKSYNIYCTLRKLLINVSVTNSTASVKVEAKPFNSTDLLDCGTFQISGWSGWNSIPTRCTNTDSNTHKQYLRFGNTNSGYQSSDYIEKLILTFTVDAVNSSKTSNYICVHNIVAIADTSWSAESNMARNGHMYTWDANQNVTFPGSITSAAGFKGTAEVATKLGTVDVGGEKNEDTGILPGRDADDIPIFLKGGVPTPCKRIPTILTGSTAPSDSVGKDGDMYLMPYATNIPAIYSGTTIPDHSIGVNGDIYILYE